MTKWRNNRRPYFGCLIPGMCLPALSLFFLSHIVYAEYFVEKMTKNLRCQLAKTLANRPKLRSTFQSAIRVSGIPNYLEGATGPSTRRHAKENNRRRL